LLCVAFQIGAQSVLSAAAAAPKVTFNTVYQINDNGGYSGFAANSTNPDIGVISGSTPTPNVVISGVGVFTASAASTSSAGTFQLQGNDVTGTLTFTGAIIGSNGVRIPAVGTTAFSLTGGISKHIKTRDGLGPSTSEMFYFWSDPGLASAMNGLGFFLIVPGKEALFSNPEANVSMPADGGFVDNLNNYLASVPTIAVTSSATALKAGETATITLTQCRPVERSGLSRR